MPTINKVVLFLLPAILLLLAGCEEQRHRRYVRLSSEASIRRDSTVQSLTVPSLSIAIAPVLSPRESFKIYSKLATYIGKKIGKSAVLIQRSTYAEINDLIRYGRVDVAFVCDYAYLEGKRDFDMEILVVPQVRGGITYHSYIIVPAESNIQIFPQLKGKIFAFGDPLSSAGWLFPTYLLSQMGQTPDAFFKGYIFTYSHDNTVRAVADRIVDGGAVDSIVYDYMLATDPRYGKETRVIFISPPYGAPPVVVPPRIHPALKAQLKAIFLSMHQDNEGQEILRSLMLDRFTEGDPHMYDFVAEMKASIRHLP